MNSISATFWAECLKVRKSKVFWISVVFFVFVSFMMGLIIFVQLHPEISGKLGMIGTKASLLRFGEPNWQNYFTLVTEGIAGVGLVGYGFITSWVFSREYSEHTLKDIIAMPVSRASIVLSKLIVIMLWSLIITVVFFASSLFFGHLWGLPDWSGEIFSQFVYRFIMVSMMSVLLSTPVAFFASYSRGFLLPVGIVILTMIMANFTGLVGLGPYFPWAIPGLFSIPPGPDEVHVGLISYIILFLTSALGLFGTLAWWQLADQK